MERMRKQPQAAVIEGEPGLVAGGFDAKHSHVVESLDANDFSIRLVACIAVTC
jgi:hypothetical protein